MYGGSGGILGPDLTGIAKRTNVAALRQSIQDPDAHMSAGFETVEVKTKSGATILGAARHEDTFSIQLFDRNEKSTFS